MPQPAAPKRRRRWFQFRLRTLFVVVTAAAVASAVCCEIVRLRAADAAAHAAVDEMVKIYHDLQAPTIKGFLFKEPVNEPEMSLPHFRATTAL